jgi:hypothetical protein
MGNLRTYIFAAYDVNALASGSQITIHQTFYSTTIPEARAAVVSVFRGLAPEGALEQSSNDNGSGTTPSSGAATTIAADQLLIGAVGTEGPSGDTAGTWQNSFTEGPRDGTTGGTADTNITVSMGYRIVSTAGSYTAAKSGITSRDWAAGIATFKTTDTGISYIGDIGSAQSKTAGTSLAVTTTAAVVAGDDIMVAFAADPAATVSSVGDSAGNTYNEAISVTNSGDVVTYIFAAYDVNALSSGSTITINHASATARAAVVSVFRGLANSAVLDQTHTGTGSSTSPTSGATSTTTQADELLIGAIGMEGPNVDCPGTWSYSFTDGLRLGTSFGSSSGGDTDITVGLGWRIVGATGAYTAAKSGLATSRDWAAAIATFKAGEEDTTDPTVTIDQASGQADPTDTSPIDFTVVFDEPVTDFATGDVDLSSSTAPGTLVGTVTEISPNDGTTYNVAVSGMTDSGDVVANIAAGVAHDGAGNPNEASTSTDNAVTYNVGTGPTNPTVTIDQGSGQADPTNASPIDFTVVFNEPVTGFETGDVTLGGTAGATTGTVTEISPNDGTTYNVAVSGMTGSGTVIASIAAGVAEDGDSNPNEASTSTDNTVTYDTDAPNTSITDYPDAMSRSTDASFSFTSTEPGSTFECQLDGGGFSACTSPKDYTGLDYGEHIFLVRAIDGAGNPDPIPASYSWTVNRLFFMPLAMREG